ncbi:hypothetical protein Ami103574_04190 [Aminipila butyrica]|uniref:Replication initiator A N-terminal domain-containing protein n=1 Tax=Aminipila butyrica TaxID=433296 RepID=A0A858BUF4_9FIRM|nr:replication initiator protein A [Aminipila butyrica]QIB68570.1 hypothetical protein Ami103574_04190 [Aminipila butyrica]
MEKLNLGYINPRALRGYNFYMIPKMIVIHQAFNGIGYGSKLLYGIILSKASLSAQNDDFIDGDGNLYVIYTVEQIMADLNCSGGTAVKMLKQLESVGLIIKKKVGQGSPNKILINMEMLDKYWEKGGDDDCQKPKGIIG